MKPESLRAASPRFIRKMLILSRLHDVWCVLKFCLSSPLTHCAPLNYCRWVKAKSRNSVMCARERFSAGFSDLASCGNEGGRPRVGAMGGKLPDKLEKCPRFEPCAPPFSVGTALTQHAPGLLGDCAAQFLRWARRALLPLPARLHTLGASRWVAEWNSRCQELQPRMPPVFRSVFAISRAPVPLFASSFFEERAERGAIS